VAGFELDSKVVVVPDEFTTWVSVDEVDEP
jgi:hypothetical protein